MPERPIDKTDASIDKTAFFTQLARIWNVTPGEAAARVRDGRALKGTDVLQSTKQFSRDLEAAMEAVKAGDTMVGKRRKHRRKGVPLRLPPPERERRGRCSQCGGPAAAGSDRCKDCYSG